jgi:cystathionine beta-synthase
VDDGTRLLDLKTVKDLIGGRGNKRLITIPVTDPVWSAIELMKKYDIENIPVTDDTGIIGSVSEGGLFNKILETPAIRTATIDTVLEKAYPIVAFDTPVERLSSIINKENGAVLSRDEAGNFHIVTKYDIIQSLAK